MKKIKLIVSDFDGVMTDNRVLVREDGLESVFCNRSDGLAISILKKNGIELVVLSKEKNKVVQTRCKKLNIEAISGSDNKITEFRKIIKMRNLAKDQVCFIGNDINDLECIKEAEISIVPFDAYPEVARYATHITNAKGGFGVIREVAQLIVKLEE